MTLPTTSKDDSKIKIRNNEEHIKKEIVDDDKNRGISSNADISKTMGISKSNSLIIYKIIKQ